MQNNSFQHSISLSEAIQLTSNFQLSRPADMPVCETFEKASILRLLETEGAESFRIYYGKKENGDVCAVLVAADAEGKDILPPSETENFVNDEDDEALILEDSFRCPHTCPPPSPLNP